MQHLQIKFAPDYFIQPGRGALITAAPLTAVHHQRRFDTAPNRNHAEREIGRQFAGAFNPGKIPLYPIAVDALLDKFFQALYRLLILI